MGYINRKTALIIIDNLKKSVSEDDYLVIVDAIRNIVSVICPSENVAPIKRGKWLPIKNMLYRTHYRCSECGRDVVVFKYSKTTLKDYPYCHCGAKMEGERRL